MIPGLRFLFKASVIGDTGVGKTSLVQRYASDCFDGQGRSTVGVEFSAKTLDVNDRSVKLHIWDCSGNNTFLPIIEHYFRKTQGFIVTFDLTDPETLNHVYSWIERVNRVNKNTDPVPILLVGNKCDCREIVTDDTIREIMDEYPQIFRYAKVSAKTGEGIDDMFTVFAAYLSTYYRYTGKAIATTLDIMADSGTQNVEEDGWHCCVI